MTNAIENLRDRVAKATGPDREIDADLWALSDFSYVMHRDGETGSIDAALAWVERVLPGWETCNASQGRLLGGTASGWFWELWNPEYEADDGASGCCGRSAPIPALAIILAGLDALIAQEKEV